MRTFSILVLAFFALALHTSAQQAVRQQGSTQGAPTQQAPTQQAAAAQAPAPSDISVEAKLVVVPTVVRDKKGALMTTLTKEDFLLQVDNKAQAVRYFDHDNDVPLTVGLLVDTSMSQRAVLDDERSASVSFLDKMLAPHRDQAFLIQFARSVDLLQDVTDSRPKLQEALKQVDAERPSFDNSNGGGNNGGGGSGGGYGGGGGRQRGGGGGAAGTALYDAVFLASDEVIAKQKGRRALILLTDGDDHGSKVTLARAIESAQRANAIVYAIYYKGERANPGGGGGRGGFPGGGRRGGGIGFPMEDFAGQNFAGQDFAGQDFAGQNFAGQMGGGGGRGGNNGQQQADGKKILERMCGETGGRVFEVTKKQTVDAIYTQIAEELRTQYRIGFTPSADAASEGYHLINLSLTQAAAKNKPTVQTRDGYYTGEEK